MAGQGQFKNRSTPAQFYRRLNITPPGATEPYSLWCNVAYPEAGVVVVKLVLAQDVGLAVGWVVELDGKRYEGAELQPGGKLLCRATP